MPTAVERMIMSNSVQPSLRFFYLETLLCFALFGSIADVGAQPLPAPTRGELLYSTHCIACHDTQIHWRDKKLVTDWKSLQKEVRRWQELAGLGWSNEEIAQVAQYLNQRLYHLTPD